MDDVRVPAGLVSVSTSPAGGRLRPAARGGRSCVTTRSRSDAPAGRPVVVAVSAALPPPPRDLPPRYGRPNTSGVAGVAGVAPFHTAVSMTSSSGPGGGFAVVACLRDVAADGEGCGIGATLPPPFPLLLPPPPLHPPPSSPFSRRMDQRAHLPLRTAPHGVGCRIDADDVRVEDPPGRSPSYPEIRTVPPRPDADHHTGRDTTTVRGGACCLPPAWAAHYRGDLDGVGAPPYLTVPCGPPGITTFSFPPTHAPRHGPAAAAGRCAVPGEGLRGAARPRGRDGG